MKLKRILTPAVLLLVLLVQFLPGTAFAPRPVGATAANANPVELKVAPVDTTVYDFAANFCSATWSSGAGALPCPGTDGAASGFVLKVTNPQLENGTIDTSPGLVVAPQNVAGGYIQGVFPAFTVQAGDRFQSIVNCTFNATGCYVLFRLDYIIGSGPQQTFWHFKERDEGLFYRANLSLSSLAGQSVQFILYMADVPGLGTPSGDRAMWGGPVIVRSSTTPPPVPISSACDRGQFIADVTIPDGTIMAPGTSFIKTFRIRNVGTCTWTTSYAMVFVSGSLMGAPSTVINLASPVASGQTMDFSIPMVAPGTPGHYRSFWRFRNASGAQFGLGSGMITFFADINVSGSLSSATTTTITNDAPDPSLPGSPVAVSVSVTGSGVTPTGTVAITGADTNCTITLSGGVGSCNAVYNSIGNKTLIATYSGDSNYTGSSTTAAHIVSTLQASTTTITNDAPDPSIPGAVVGVTVTVSGFGSTPTGTVAITGADTNCTATLAGGTGTCNVVFNTSGPKSLTATYSGNINYGSSTDSESHTVTTGASVSATNITSDVPDPSTPGQSVVVNVTVNGAGLPLPTGMVLVSGADTTCSILLAGGTGSCSVIFNTSGSKTITATYSGDGVYAPSTGSTGHTVDKVSTTTTITAHSPNPSTPGQAVLVSFNVLGGGVSPTGTVSVTGADVNCTATLSGGAGSCNIVFNTIGPKVITATYNGDSNYLGSVGVTPTSPTIGFHSVLNVSTTTITSFSPEPSTPGNPAPAVTVNFKVTGAGPIPTGNVSITGQDAGCAAPVALGGTGTGSCTVFFTSAGAKLLTATYAGDTVYSPSSGTGSHTVNKATSTTLIVGPVAPEPSLINQSVLVSVLVTGVTGAVDRTGTVAITLSGGQTSTCTAVVPLSPGLATCNVVFTAAGTFTITAIYSGDGNYLTSTDSTYVHTVN